MIEINGLHYVFPNKSVGLNTTKLDLPDNTRTVLVGANGAGKSTLLKILAGKTLAKGGAVHIDGQDPFRDGMSGVVYLGSEWANNPTVKRDIEVHVLLDSIGGRFYPDRLDELVDILDIDINWRMHAVSDGERRRVQLAMGLLCPWNTLLLDEVTVDLDLIMRHRLLAYLEEETQKRNCQVVYATHIFDGLSQWPTHVIHMSQGDIEEVIPWGAKHQNGSDKKSSTGNSSLFETAFSWLKGDLKLRVDRKVKWTEFLQGRKNN